MISGSGLWFCVTTGTAAATQIYLEYGPGVTLLNNMSTIGKKNKD